MSLIENTLLIAGGVLSVCVICFELRFYISGIMWHLIETLHLSGFSNW